ncbi:MAG TPA: hypothetical protein DCX95_01170 [Elusimicrobia bacterium]|nr:hypothetical protein [Elusimicrobiota bacterium]
MKPAYSQLDSLIQRDYLEYAKRAEENGFVVMTKEDWFKSMKNEYKPAVSPGTYLIKAKSQMIGGFMVQLFAGAGILANAYSYNKNTEGNFSTRNYKSINAGLTGLALMGLAMQISGVVNIGKAGVSLNEHGIGIKIKF